MIAPLAVEILRRLETDAEAIDETSANALNASEEAHELAKRAIDNSIQVTDEIWLLEQRYVVWSIIYTTARFLITVSVNIDLQTHVFLQPRCCS